MTVILVKIDEKPVGTKVPIKIVAINIWVGHLPLQSEKLLVMMAISLSLGLSMIRVATTPAALQPHPMLIVRACFPCAPDLLNNESRLKATLGKYPKSSSKVNMGKNIAIGGSITEITQPKAIYTPSIRKPSNHHGRLIAEAPSLSKG